MSERMSERESSVYGSRPIVNLTTRVDRTRIYIRDEVYVNHGQGLSRGRFDYVRRMLCGSSGNVCCFLLVMGSF